MKEEHIFLSNGLLDLFVKMGEKGQRDLVCGAPLDDWAVMLIYVMSYARAHGE